MGRLVSYWILSGGITLFNRFGTYRYQIQYTNLELLSLPTVTLKQHVKREPLPPFIEPYNVQKANPEPK